MAEILGNCFHITKSSFGMAFVIQVSYFSLSRISIPLLANQFPCRFDFFLIVALCQSGFFHNFKKGS